MRLYLLSIGFALLIIEIFSLLPPRKIQTSPSVYPEGAIHVHSKYSHDGGGSIEKIAADAKTANMDFVVVTDHNTAEARRKGEEGLIDGVDMFIEMEVSTPAGHLVSFFSHTNARNLTDTEVVDLTWRHFLGTERRSGMFIATAHPSNIKRPWNRLDRYPDGTEIVNFDSIWQRQLQNSFLGFASTLALIPLNPFMASIRYFELYPKDLSSWDTMNSFNRGHFGYLGHDTHEKLILTKEVSAPWPQYISTFKLASNMILVPKPLPLDFETRKRTLYEALQKGKLAVVFRALYPAPGNDWWAQCPSGVFRSGDAASLESSCVFHAQVPPGFPHQGVFRLKKDGDLVSEAPIGSGSAEMPLSGPGNYRLEVWVREPSLLRILHHSETPYVLYNPITFQ